MSPAFTDAAFDAGRLRAEIRKVDRKRERLAHALQECHRRRAELERAYPRSRLMGDRVREARTRRGLTQTMVARIAGLPHRRSVGSNGERTAVG